MKDDFIIDKKKLTSRLIVGTGKYKSFQQTAEAIKASGTDMVTVAVRRVNITDKKKITLMDYIQKTIELHNHFGKNDNYVQGAGGNISIKDGDIIHIKKSGLSFRSMKDKNDIISLNISKEEKITRHDAITGRRKHIMTVLKKFQPDRALLVRTMVISIQYWQQSTFRSKLDFARESGIWTVNMDNDSPQTRTLDKYLHIDTLPSRPKVEEIIRSAHFIYSNCNVESPLRDELKSILDSLISSQLEQSLGTSV